MVPRKMKAFSSTSLNYLAGLVVGTLAVTSCGNSEPRSQYLAGLNTPVQQQTSGNAKKHPSPAIPDDVSYWDGDSATGSPMIRINRKQQKAFFYKGGVLVGVSRISSGTEDHGTPAGRYKIIQKSKDHKSSAYGVFKDRATGQTTNDNVDIRIDKPKPNEIFYNAPMPNFMRITGGIGMHTGYLPGYAASHGCIRMPHHMSEHFFENVELGTPVIVE
jgi:lipoprotein-anchoring transpeptidase ErfK/SrfK